MNEQTAAASSPADVDVFRGEQPTLDEYNTYRQNGELPARFKPAEDADTAPADPPKQTVESEADEAESAGDSETPTNQQEKPKVKGALDRVAQLAAENARETDPAKKAKNQATIAKILKGAGLIETQADSSPAPVKTPPVTPQPFQQQPDHPQFTRPEPAQEDKNPDGTLKYDTYEKFTRDLARWDREQERAEEQRKYAAAQREAAEISQRQVFEAKKAELTSRYPDFETITLPFAYVLLNDPRISPVVIRAIDDSAVYAELAYVLAKDATFMDLARSSPQEARLYAIKTERDIIEGHAGRVTTPENKKTQAPKPPSPVGGTTSRAFDVSDDSPSISNEEWMRKRNQQVEKRKGR